ncbi:hypothetical protein CYMTET_43612 [Cymbomonas tetramitiformis]|uniref:Uncharacterized protein n=1 Tax=Cymbomonas tetramitiformis TaxID=36881 RepID=A0AAE0C1T9_9CHLO|nr:hypothetical protein CYMTET_43612 [Cymbomonas tetramitiformis]
MEFTFSSVRRLEWPRLAEQTTGHLCTAFHPALPLIAVGDATCVVEFDALTGAQLSFMELSRCPVQLIYAPNIYPPVLLMVTQDYHVVAVDTGNGRRRTLYAPARRADKPLTESHLALAPHRPWLFFASPHSSSINVVVITGKSLSKSARKLKTDHKKPVTALACHPHQPLLFAGYSDGSVRVYNLTEQALSFAFTLEVSGAKSPVVAATVLKFNKAGNMLLVGDSSGGVSQWSFADVSLAPTLIAVGVAMSRMAGPTRCMVLDEELMCVLVVTTSGVVRLWHTLSAEAAAGAGAGASGGGTKPALVRGELQLNEAKLLLLEHLGENPSPAHVPSPPIVLLMHPITGCIALVVLEGRASQPVLQNQSTKTGRLERGSNVALLQLVNRRRCLHSRALCQPHHLDMDHFTGRTATFLYPQWLVYCSKSEIMAAEVSGGSKRSLFTVPGDPSSGKHIAWIRHNYLRSCCLLWLAHPSAPGELLVLVKEESRGARGAMRQVASWNGRGAAFLGDSGDHFALLEADGKSLSGVNTTSGSGARNWQLALEHPVG